MKTTGIERWAIWGPCSDDKTYMYYEIGGLWEKRSELIGRFTEEFGRTTWKEARKEGFRCVKITLPTPEGVK